MSRYFIEVAYKGTHFKGFQSQIEVNSIQGEINKALQILFKTPVATTTSSRTDAGVHALQNYLHFDTNSILPSSLIYNLNSIISQDILVKSITPVNENSHARFDAIMRKYAYHIIPYKNPFLRETAYFLPFKLDIALMNEATQLLFQYTSFESFSKRNTDVNNFNCKITTAHFEITKDEIIFHVASNRFLRGMVRALVGTLLLVGRKKISIAAFEEIICKKDCTYADFSAPAHGLFLENVFYPETVFILNNETQSN